VAIGKNTDRIAATFRGKINIEEYPVMAVQNVSCNTMKDALGNDVLIIDPMGNRELSARVVAVLSAQASSEPFQYFYPASTARNAE
jgi:nucleoside-triphosphatase THEP1